MDFNELRGNRVTADIRDIEIKSRRAQYTYLAKVAAASTNETAIIYRDDDSMVPLVDLLERQGIDYRLLSREVGFFKERVVEDIKNIIRFAYNPSNIELFMLIYHKIALGMGKSVALEACRTCKETGLSVLEAALRYMNPAQGVLKRIKAINDHFNKLPDDPADRAVYRIVNYMGYGLYLERMEIDASAIKLLDALGFSETTPQRLVERLGELEEIINNKPQNPACPIILSSISASREVEYDTVYLMDAKDGILPRRVLKTDEANTPTPKELADYEAERMLYYTAVTRAKHNLNIFSFKHNSTFTDELLSKPSKPQIKSHARKNYLLSKSAQSQLVSQKKVVEDEYQEKLEEIKTSGHLKHKTYGDGRVINFNGDTIEVAFPNKTAKCKLKFMMENGLIL